MNLEQEPKLESWKEIAAYLQRDVKTAHRWEKTEGLPVHRHSHKSRASVYAYPAEIDAWRAGRKAAPEPVVVPLWKKPAFAAAMAMSLVMAGSLVRPQAAEAQGQTRTVKCSGGDCDQRVLTPSGKLVPRPARSGVQFSPDGSKIAYTKRNGPSSRESVTTDEVIVARADGSEGRTVYRGGWCFGWSADGKRVLVGSALPDRPTNSGLAWLDVASGAVQKLPTVHANFDIARVSPDGKYVAFNASPDKDGDVEENVFVMASDGSGETMVNASAAYQEPIGWTPDGTLVYGQRGATTAVWSVGISKGKLAQPVKTSVEFDKNTQLLGISRAGGLYYRTLTSGSDIFTVDLDATGKVTGKAVPVPVPGESTGGIVLPRWSPDSQRLAYMHLGPPRKMYVFSFESGKEQQIGVTNLPGAEHCWNSDGSAVFLNDQKNALRFDLKTDQVTPMFVQSTPRLANCSGDVALVRTGTGVDSRRMAGDAQKELFRMAENTGASAPALSHDGKNVAWVTPGVYVPALGATWVLHTVSTEGGAVRDLVTEKAPAQLQPYWGFAWSADDRFVYFVRRADEKSPFELMRVLAAGGAAEGMGLARDDIRDLDMAPDGKRMVFSLGVANFPEVWELKGFLPKK